MTYPPLDLTASGSDGPHDFRRAYADTRNGQLHYAEFGQGEPLVLLAETPRSHRYFRKLMRPLGERFRVIALDTPGFGNSHPLPEPVSIAAIAGCVVALADALELGRFSVMGTNTGDKVATAVGADWPERVDRVVICGYTHSLIPERETRDAALRKFFRSYHPPEYAEDADGAYLVRRWAAAQATLATDCWPPALLTASRIEPDQLAAVEAVASDFLLGWRSAVPVYEAVFAFDMVEAAARVVAPTLILELTTEEEAHYGRQARRLAALMQNATPDSVAVMLGSAMEVQGPQIAEAALRFLSAVEPQKIGNT